MKQTNEEKTKALSVGSTRTVERWSIKELVDTYIYDIDLDADYQREKVWVEKDDERLIDSVLHDIDIPKIYLAEADSGYECIDGKQRMLALSKFFRPGKLDKKPLQINYLSKKYTFKQLKKEHHKVAQKIEDYKLDFVIYKRSDISDKFLRDIFIRLQLGVRLNSGEILNAHMGTIRDFIFEKIGNNGPFIRKTSLSNKRFSRPFTLAQICLNSFARKESGKFERARLDNLEFFFKDKYSLDTKDGSLLRIRRVLNLMDKAFGNDAKNISSRAVAVSAYLFAEGLYLNQQESTIKDFARFYVHLLREIKQNMKLLRKYKKPDNSLIMEEFQRYISQATVEPYAISNRDEFLKKAFSYYQDPKTKGKIIGNQ